MKRLLLALLLMPLLVFGQVTTSPSVTGIPASQSNVAITGGTISGVNISSSTMTGQTSGAAVAAGKVGEKIESIIASGSAVGLTTNVAANVTSITITAGYWEVFGYVGFINGGTTASTYIAGSMATTSAVQSSDGFLLGGIGGGIAGQLSAALPVTIFNVTTNTQIFLVATSQFTISTQSAFGRLTAIRIN